MDAGHRIQTQTLPDPEGRKVEGVAGRSLTGSGNPGCVHCSPAGSAGQATVTTQAMPAV